MKIQQDTVFADYKDVEPMREDRAVVFFCADAHARKKKAPVVSRCLSPRGFYHVEFLMFNVEF